MATSKWASSLANIEGRLRRSLGISGALGIELDPRLIPVVIADDLRRPGCVGSDFRGRRWAASVSPGTIAAGQVGLVELLALGLNTTVGNAEKGGIIVDTLELSIGGTVQTQLVEMSVYYVSPFTAQQTASIRAGIMVDPSGRTGFPGNYDPAPVMIGTSAAGLTVTTLGNRIWDGWMLTNGSRYVIDLDLFLQEQAFLAVGNPVGLVAGQPATFFATWRGRVF